VFCTVDHIVYRVKFKIEDEIELGVVMGYKLYTANFKDRIGLGSGPIFIHF
jgi:hypothetical protein